MAAPFVCLTQSGVSALRKASQNVGHPPLHPGTHSWNCSGHHLLQPSVTNTSCMAPVLPVKKSQPQQQQQLWTLSCSHQHFIRAKENAEGLFWTQIALCELSLTLSHSANKVWMKSHIVSSPSDHPTSVEPSRGNEELSRAGTSQDVCAAILWAIQNAGGRGGGSQGEVISHQDSQSKESLEGWQTGFAFPSVCSYNAHLIPFGTIITGKDNKDSSKVRLLL